MVMSQRCLALAGFLLALLVSGSVGAQSIYCESRDYRRAYCPTGPITSAQIISQTSNAACIQGRTWGYDGSGIWVNQGCAGDFAYQGGGFRPPGPPGNNSVACESRDYQQNYCATGVRVTRAWVAQQQSQSPCIQGRTWGYDARGIWVSQGCSAVFGFQGTAGPAPPPPMGNSVACESRNYQQSWCNTGQRIGRVWVAEQRSSAPCIQGQTWGYQDRAVWVNGGCSAIFAYESR